jgi:hypothetical protein
MIAHPYRVAIARILSDLIKSDKIIEKSEIALFNTLQEQFGITQQDRIEAQSITITHAMNCVRDLDDDKKQILQQALLKTAKADNQCVAKEALILLALKYILADTDGKYEVLSCDTRGSYIEDKFIMYIESDEYEDINDDILCDLEGICDKLSLWNFDFVYIPSITAQFRTMDPTYMKDIIRYMKPTFCDKTVNRLYDRLTSITTESFTTELLGAQMNMPQLRESEPSLLINFGTSVVFNPTHNQQPVIHTDFLKIRIDDTTNHEIKQFITDYDQFITHRESVSPELEENQFKYFGFYKILFDFLTITNNTGDLVEDNITIDLLHKSLKIGDTTIKLSPTQLTTYILILQQSIRGYGLPHLRNKAQIDSNKKLCDNLTKHFQTIYASFGEAHNDWHFADNTRNIAAYISHISQKLRNQIAISPETYIPYQINKDGLDYYTTKVTLDKVYVKIDSKEYPLKDYTPWKL